MRSCILAAILLVAGVPGAVAQQDMDSAGYALNGCRLLSNDTFDGLFEQSRCADRIKTIFRNRNGAGNCAPRRSNIKENSASIVRYIETRPERWHEKFTVLAQEALLEDWPCQK